MWLRPFVVKPLYGSYGAPLMSLALGVVVDLVVIHGQERVVSPLDRSRHVTHQGVKGLSPFHQD